MANVLAFPLSLNQSCRMLKAELAAAFPGIAFSVRQSRGTGYGTIYVSWTDGPMEDAVKVVTDRYETQGFDGMTDSTTHHKSDVAGSAIGMILESREISATLRAECVERLKAEGFVEHYSGAMDCAAISLAHGCDFHTIERHHAIWRA